MKSRRLLYQLAPSTPRTDEIGFGLLPTAASATDCGGPKGLSGGQGNGKKFKAMWALLKTPSAVETEGGIMEIRPGANTHYKLRDQINHIQMLPTPRPSKMTNENEDAWQIRKDAGKVSTPPLGLAINMLPTPATRDYKGANGPEHMTKDRPHMDQLPNAITHGTNRGLKLQPAFVEWMMGYPDGWTNIEPED
jgi:hypothetical protein